MRAPNSTPIVRSCCWRNLLSVNCSRRQDFPTPKRESAKLVRLKSSRCSAKGPKGVLLTGVANDNVLEEISVRH